jgi:hypothetical protein
MPIASPIMKTSVWSATVDGDVRKKKAKVMWKREMELMMVAPDMRPMVAVEELPTMERKGLFPFLLDSCLIT